MGEKSLNGPMAVLKCHCASLDDRKKITFMSASSKASVSVFKPYSMEVQLDNPYMFKAI